MQDAFKIEKEAWVRHQESQIAGLDHRGGLQHVTIHTPEFNASEGVAIEVPASPSIEAASEPAAVESSDDQWGDWHSQGHVDAAASTDTGRDA